METYAIAWDYDYDDDPFRPRLWVLDPDRFDTAEKAEANAADRSGDPDSADYFAPWVIVRTED